MGLFGKMVADAKPMEGSGFWAPGQYVVEIDVCKAITNRKNELCFIVSGVAKKSSNAECPVGCTRDWVVNMKHDSSPGNVKSFIRAATGLEEEEIDEDGTEAVVDEKNPLHGELVALEVTMVKTRDGNDFSKHVWRQLTPAQRKELA